MARPDPCQCVIWPASTGSGDLGHGARVFDQPRHRRISLDLDIGVPPDAKGGIFATLKSSGFRTGLASAVVKSDKVGASRDPAPRRFTSGADPAFRSGPFWRAISARSPSGRAPRCEMISAAAMPPSRAQVTWSSPLVRPERKPSSEQGRRRLGGVDRRDRPDAP